METGLTLTLHGVTLAATLAVLGVVLAQHRVWTRMKDRINDMWKEYCDSKKIRFTTLDENGH